MENNPKEILNYITPDGKIPFEEWLNSLRDLMQEQKLKPDSDEWNWEI
jgi:hypothetical protein